MLKKIKANIYGIAFGTALAVIAVLVIVATIWSVLAANENVDQAVNKLSAFYMEELVGKRELVLRDALDRDFEQLNRVISVLRSKEILNSDELRDFLSNAQTMCGANKLAIVDGDNTVYTAHSTFSDASRYSFLQDDFNSPQIITSNLYGAKKQVVVAVPVQDITVQGKRIVACFMQLDIDNAVGGLIYEDKKESVNTFIGLYYKNGDNLTSSDFEDIESGTNLLEYFKTAKLSDEQTITEIEKSFCNGEKGLATVVSGTQTKYIYYMPVEGTDWMLTVMVRDNTIKDQLEYTSKKMIRRNIFQVVSTAVAIVVVFLIISGLNKKNIEMRARQHELEAKAENEQELRRAYKEVESSKNELQKQLDVIGGMSNAFFAVYSTNLKTLYYEPVKEIPFIRDALKSIKRLDEAAKVFLSIGVHPDDMEKMRKFTDINTLVNRLENTDSLVMEYHSLQSEMEWCRASWIVASRDENGNAERVLYASEDISQTVRERKRYETELKRARDEAEKASNAKTAFLFNMSHDIRTPMNAILGYTDIGLLHFEDTEKAKDSFRKIKTAGAHLLGLINDILEMSRIESGKLELVEHEVDMLQVVETITSLGKSLALPKSIDFQTVVGDVRNQYIYADELHINEVIINLISNAVKYTPDGGKVRYTINQISDVIDGKALYRLDITDTGIGMSEEFQTQLFDAFSRETSSTVSKTEGAGLGLSIVKNIVEIAGGTIKVDSTLGKGSGFTVEIPFRVMDAEAIDRFIEENNENRDIRTDVSLEGKKVLLVEDNEINREIATMILTDARLTVEEAQDGDIAVNILRETGIESFDYILMDIQMPVMDGYEATKAIRKLPDGDKIKIIALSANAFEEDKRKSLAVGMNSHVAKPINAKELIDVLIKLS